jgi:hypothetical protein
MSPPTREPYDRSAINDTEHKLPRTQNAQLVRHQLFAHRLNFEEDRIPVSNLFQMAKLNGFDPQAWLTDMLSRIAGRKVNKIDELLPWRYAQAS